MTVFGRDSILTSIQALPFVPELAESTLRTLAGRQGREVDDFRDEEPGKIMHEQRFGEMTAFLERPHSPYYGAADVTPLFLILLDEYERWTGNTRLVRQLEPEARAALNWIDKYGDRNGDGYIDYARKQETGLENQCWKDSWNSISSRMAPSRSCHAPPVRSRATPMMRRCAAPGSRARSGATPSWPSRLETEAERAETAVQPRLLDCRIASSLLWPWMVTVARLTR